MQTIRHYGSLFSALRWHSDVKVRAAWYFIVGSLMFLMLLFEPTRALFIFLWVARNLIFGSAAVFWAFFHPRAVHSASQSALRWAFVGALFGGLIVFANADSWLPRTVPSAAVTFITLALTPFIFIWAYLIGIFSATVPAFRLRKQPGADSERAAALAVTVSWFYTGILYLAARPIDPSRVGMRLLLHFPGAVIVRDVIDALTWGGALPTLWITLYLVRLMDRPRPFPVRLLRFISERLILTYKWRGRLRVRDLRGMALGLIAALITLGLGPIRLLIPLQSLTLNSLLRLQGAVREESDGIQSDSGNNFVVHTSSDGGSQDYDESKPVKIVSKPDPSDSNPGYDRQIVLLTMDNQTRRLALSSRSECAFQTDMIRLLHSYGALQIVLPVPALDESLPVPAAGTFVPQPAYADVMRSEKDVPALVQAIQAAGSVTAVSRAAPTNFVPFAEQQILNAATAAVPALLPTYSTPRLPMLPVRWEKSPPGPLRFFALTKGEKQIAPLDTHGGRFVQIADTKFLPGLDDALLLDFQSEETGRRIPHFTYNEILEHSPLCLRAASATLGTTKPKDDWLPPAQFFRNKIVFLDSLTLAEQETSVGKMSAMEAQARATHALFTDSLVYRPRPLWPLLALLTLGAFVGALGFRRNPLEASWRMALPLLVLLTVYIGNICILRCWLDPVAPAITVFFAFLLVTQATYAVEHDEGGRTRTLLERFVAPQLLEELLQDPQSLGLGGKMQRVCVLFADVRNFTGFTEDRDPQEVIGVINEYMTALTDAMYQHGGIFDKYTGDGLMAFFRITDETATSPQIQQAVTAAMAMQQAVLAISAQRVQAGKIPLAIGIGLHYGEAVVGMVGSPSLANYTALGHTVVISARLQSIAAGGEIVLSESVFEKTAGLHAVAGDPVQVKGITAPVRPYRLRALPPVPTALPPVIPPL